MEYCYTFILAIIFLLYHEKKNIKNRLMYVPVDLYFNSEFCVLANPIRIILGIMMKKAKNQNATGER